MPASRLDDIRYQTRIIAHVERRDAPKRIASAALIVAICWYAGAERAAIALLVMIALYELVSFALGHFMPRDGDELPLGFVFCFWLVNCTSALAYLIPSFVLAMQPSTALMLVGFIWLFGVYVHVSNTFAAFPFYNWSVMGPSFVAAFCLLYVVAQTDFQHSPVDHWIVAIGALTVYVFNTIETLNKQKDTQKALALARREATGRLRRLEHLTRHDNLTGALNRRAFDADLAKMLLHRRGGNEIAVLLIDLDGFKPINDTYSHEAGDEVLIQIVKRLHDVAGETGIVARLGGDEFAVAFDGLPSSDAAMRLATYVGRAISAPMIWNQKTLRIAASIGVNVTGALPVGDPDTVSALCAGADQAMYRAKASPNAAPVLFKPDQFTPRLSLTDRGALIIAIQNHEIRPYYQPKIHLGTGQVVGFEALARWIHPDGALRLPAQFLSQINELGLQGDFLIEMTKQVMADISTLTKAGFDPGQVSINVPEVTLATHSGLSDFERVIANHPDAAGHITIEITEDVFIARAAEAIQNSVTQLRRGGVRVSLDDFGTGFASFHHLRQLEFDELKIDSSFVADLGRDPAVDVMVQGFLSIASGLGVAVIAEGVENQAQRQDLLGMGCMVAQGFLFSAALPFEKVAPLLDAPVDAGKALQN
ncbi:putative bifunctional diguanylate cyclase/phosphodiesterase [Octadecabacter sp. R77987]|uniref:putative bifunctional diguanylate cyclase/phosphodiesterase n=1 Tax=Octadecabacter sp. R77987 TaxID=3093874 RepID=UPI003672A229